MGRCGARPALPTLSFPSPFLLSTTAPRHLASVTPPPKIPEMQPDKVLALEEPQVIL